MKNLKRIAIIICLTLAFAVSANAADSVEISFKVGDSTLSINGSAVQVQTPYVVGEGVTLVPLRVITEAFGATVLWEDSTQTVTLDYPDVNIVLQIGNPVADVNQKAQALLCAPELTNDTTMVPLRFISENFGAVVTYDETTEQITVKKGQPQNGSAIVSGSVSNSLIGDSFYKWTMENPTDMTMEERSFDGLYTTFSKTDGENVYAIGIAIEPLSEDYDFERDFINTKNGLSKYTLVKADKDTHDADKKIMHLQAKTKDEYVNLKAFVTPEYCIRLTGYFSNETPEIRDEYIRIMDTFDSIYKGVDEYDLSNVTGGMRTFSDENLGISFRIPSDFYLASSEESENLFIFKKLDYNDSVSGISFGVYSKSDAGTAAEMAESDRKRNRETHNEDLVWVSQVSEKKYRSFDAYEYKAETTKTNGRNSVMRDIFFELGDYVYNLTIELKTPYKNSENIIKSIADSVNASQINPDKVGLILRNTYDTEGTFVSKTSDWSMDIPNSFVEQSVSPGRAVYFDTITGTIVQFDMILSSEASYSNARKILEETAQNQQNSAKGKVLTLPRDLAVCGERTVNMIYTVKDDEANDLLYCHQYMLVYGGKYYGVFTVGISEVYHTDALVEKIESIVGSYKNNR